MSDENEVENYMAKSVLRFLKSIIFLAWLLLMLVVTCPVWIPYELLLIVSNILYAILEKALDFQGYCNINYINPITDRLKAWAKK
ncbi:MAG: hypothetical protein PHX43_09495 [Alphaproteobacteria bacterium]|nr:hypothetical protein [Alphaproteobacteria bacterium]